MTGCDSRRQLLGNLFELDQIEAQQLKGIAGLVRAWAVLRPASVESRFEAMHGVTNEPRAACPPLVKRMIAAGWLGRKTGRGLHTYADTKMYGA